MGRGRYRTLRDQRRQKRARKPAQMMIRVVLPEGGSAITADFEHAVWGRLSGADLIWTSTGYIKPLSIGFKAKG